MGILALKNILQLNSLSKIFFIVCFTCFASDSIAQSLSARKLAVKNINDLKNGALLVRLSTGEHVVNAYRQVKREDMAIEFAEKIAEKNKLIAEAFKNNFTFCPVYFFYSNFSENIISGNYNKVVLLNSQLAPDTSINLYNTSFLIAEFSKLDADTTGHWEFYTNKNPTSDGNREARLSGGSDSNISALVIKNDKFAQLRKPFPYYVKYHPQRDANKEINLRVKLLNEKLIEFYNH